jgi:uncharacterized protein YndB with AHSA1/START domain
MTAELGTVHEAADGRTALRFERRLGHPVERVWRALTEPADLDHWFPQGVSADWRPGGVVRFSSEAGDGFEGEVVEVDPPRTLAFTWGDDLLRFELAAEGDGCTLVLTQTFAERAKSARDAAGWHVCLDALVALVDGSGAVAGEGWADVHPRYVDRFGPGYIETLPPSG